MPKIRQALAVLAAAASCIAFNTYRYPVVREMVAAISLPAQQESAKAVERSTAVAARTRDAPATPEISKPRDRAVCKDGVCSMPLPDSPTASLAGNSQTKSFGSDPTQEGIAGGSDLGSTPGPGDPRGATPPDATSGRKSKGSVKTPSQRAKSSAQSKSSESSLSGRGSEIPSPRLAESFDASNRAESESKAASNQENFDLRTSNPTAELKGKGSEPSESPSGAPDYGAADENPGSAPPRTKGTAKEPWEGKSQDRSPSGASGVPTKTSEDDTKHPKSASLVPIVRPASRTQRSETAAAKAMAGFQLTGQRGTKSEGVRHLPPVGSDFPTEPPSLDPELARSYPVTSAE